MRPLRLRNRKGADSPVKNRSLEGKMQWAGDVEHNFHE
jgi:hypothetical protein